MVFTQYPVTTVPRSKQVSWDPPPPKSLAETPRPKRPGQSCCGENHGLRTNNENFRTIKPCFWGISAYPPSFPFHSPYIGLMVGTSALAMKHHPIPASGHDVFKISPQVNFTRVHLRPFMELSGVHCLTMLGWESNGVKCEQGNQHPQIGNTTVIPSTDLLAAYRVC